MPEHVIHCAALSTHTHIHSVSLPLSLHTGTNTDTNTDTDRRTHTRHALVSPTPRRLGVVTTPNPCVLRVDTAVCLRGVQRLSTTVNDCQRQHNIQRQQLQHKFNDDDDDNNDDDDDDDDDNNNNNDDDDDDDNGNGNGNGNEDDVDTCPPFAVRRRSPFAVRRSFAVRLKFKPSKNRKPLKIENRKIEECFFCRFFFRRWVAMAAAVAAVGSESTVNEGERPKGREGK